MATERIIKMRVTEEEYDYFDDLAREHRTTKADILRFLVFEKNKTRKLPSRHEILDIRKQISGVAKNINQIAAAMNRMALNKSITIDEARSEKAGLRDLAKEFKAQVRNMNEKLGI